MSTFSPAKCSPSHITDHNDSTSTIHIIFTAKKYVPGGVPPVIMDLNSVPSAGPTAIWAGQAVRLNAVVGQGLSGGMATAPEWYADPAGCPLSGYSIAPDFSYCRAIPFNTLNPEQSGETRWYWVNGGPDLEARCTVVDSTNNFRFASADFNVIKPESTFSATMIVPCAWKSTRTQYGMGLGYYEVDGLGSKPGITFSYGISNGPVWQDTKNTPLGVSELLQLLDTWKSSSPQTSGDCLQGLQRPILDHGDFPADDDDTPADYDLDEELGNDLQFAATTYLTWKYPDGIFVILRRIDWGFREVVRPRNVPLLLKVGLFTPTYEIQEPGRATIVGEPSSDTISWNSNCVVGGD